MEQALEAALGASAGGVRNLKRLSGGANMETWAFDLAAGAEVEPLILRRSPAAAENGASVGQFTLAVEAALVALAGEHAVPTPRVRHILQSEDELGSGYVMSREPGEALPFRILGDDRFEAARERLAYQCGAALGRIHAVPVEQLPEGIPQFALEQQLARSQDQLDEYGNVSPVHQLALNWLRDNQPARRGPVLVHGDFRNGNLLVDESGLVSVLDWELAHVGSPVEDLGYLCGNVWRFGLSHKPVGGFGQYDELLAGYRDVTGWAPAVAELHYWEVYCALNWGIVCLTMLEMYRSGADATLERAAVGRRVTESEIDLLLLLEGRL